MISAGGFVGAGEGSRTALRRDRSLEGASASPLQRPRAACLPRPSRGTAFAAGNLPVPRTPRPVGASSPSARPSMMSDGEFVGAGEGSRTPDLKLGKLALYRLSYARPRGERIP